MMTLKQTVLDGTLRWCCRLPVALVIALSLAGPAAAQQQLGEAPRLGPGEEPAQLLQPYTPGIRAVSFDPMVRSEVADAYINTYLPQGSVAIGWSGNVASCNAGTTSTQYRQATIDRVNYYRAHAGVPGTVVLYGGSEASGTQQAALMFSANNTISHFPPASWSCYSSGGATAAGKSNIAISWGYNAAAGPNAVDLYMDDSGLGNEAVGHRRWILYPPQVRMDSGTIPNQGAQAAANSLWVIGGFGSRPPTPNGVAWPPRGYVPWQVLPSSSNRWSFSWPNANFSGASISMKRNGAALGTPVKETPASGFGDNTLVWEPQGVSYGNPGVDVTYTVTISGISGGGAPSSISYDVVVIDPYTGGPGPNQPPTITAPASFAVTEDVASSLNGISFADPDAGSGSLTATFTVPTGSLSAPSSGGVVGGGTPNARTLQGSRTALNSYLAGGNLRYTTAPNATANVAFSIGINDNGHSGSGGAQSASANRTITVNAVNDAPTLSAPGFLPVFASGTAAVSGVGFADVDAGSGGMTVTLVAPSGITLSGASGDGVTASGSGGTRAFNGSLSALNSYFAAGTARMSGPGFTGPANLQITINDNGNTGSGGAKSASASVQLRGGILFANGFE
ncbi:MAG: hypothetical protein WCY72_09415 [Lysobacteraceae bacterium]